MNILKELQKANNIAVSMAHMEGLPMLLQHTSCIVTVKNSFADTLEINIVDSKFTTIENTISLPFNRVKNIGILTDGDIITSNKNVVGRSIVGGLFFGELGAIVGGMSGTAPKKTIVTKHFIVINYINKEQELASISFSVNYLAQKKQIKNLLSSVKTKISKEKIEI